MKCETCKVCGTSFVRDSKRKDKEKYLCFDCLIKKWIMEEQENQNI